MNIQEASDAVGKEWAAAKFSDGQIRAEGEVIGFSIVPMVCIKTRSGEQVWWRHDMVDVAERPKQSPRKLGDQAPVEVVGSADWNVPGVTDSAPASVTTRIEWFDANGKHIGTDEVQGDATLAVYDPESGAAMPLAPEPPFGAVTARSRLVVSMPNSTARKIGRP